MHCSSFGNFQKTASMITILLLENWTAHRPFAIHTPQQQPAFSCLKFPSLSLSLPLQKALACTTSQNTQRSSYLHSLICGIGHCKLFLCFRLRWEIKRRSPKRFKLSEERGGGDPLGAAVVEQETGKFVEAPAFPRNNASPWLLAVPANQNAQGLHASQSERHVFPATFRPAN